MVYKFSLLHTKILDQGSCKTQNWLESIGIHNSPNSIALQDDYVTVVEDRPIMSAKYRLPVTFRQNLPTQQSHGILETAKLSLSALTSKAGHWSKQEKCDLGNKYSLQLTPQIFNPSSPV